MVAGHPAGRRERAAPSWLARIRPWLAPAAVIVVLAVLVPPFGTYARRYAFAEALQFVVFAVAAPAALVLGGPRRLPGARCGPGESLRRSRGRAQLRRDGVSPAVTVLAVFIALVIAWRLPATVRALARDPGLAAAEMVTLAAAGSALWRELVPRPSVSRRPGLSRPQRAAMAAAAMWTIWVLAYVMGMSGGGWSAGYSHAAGLGLSTAADQQIAVAIMWAVPALCFPPVIFGVIMPWLRDSDDLDEELRRAGGDVAGGRLGGTPRPPRGWRSPPA